MLGRHADAAYWLAEAVAVPGGQPGAARDVAEGMRELSTLAQGDDTSKKRRGALWALAGRLLEPPELPGFGGALATISLASLDGTEAAPSIIQRLVDGPDTWLAGLARIHRARCAENEGRLAPVRPDVAAALECFARAGDRWGLTKALQFRALLRQYDGDLDGALADLDEAKSLAREFAALSLSDEIYLNLRLVDLHARLGATGRAGELIAAARERALRSASPEMAVLFDAREARLRIRTGDLVRARELVESAESGLSGQLPFSGDHGHALIGVVRGELCLALADGPGAAKALERAYTAAVESHDMPIVATVAVTTAGLAALHGRFHDMAVFLGAAARLRGAHDPTDLTVRTLTSRGHAALGQEHFTGVYENGWHLEMAAALNRTDPARLR
ncbi:hypothetical protein [Streptomyces sp. NRRL F-5755]|uniref:hypothetical protein n=1 Tax=Streptomyces sp. NRRL F-5755 TaxID=1519475 RepID=UPI0006ADB6AD|nr:hypothetical protein [Streptomyces sp. NRRL F-5755]